MPTVSPATPVRLSLALVALILLGATAYLVVANPTLTWIDAAIPGWVSAHRSPGLSWVMTLATATGGPAICLAYTSALVLLCFARGRPATAAGVAAITCGGAGLNVGLKHWVERARPVVEDPLLTLSTYSFPSGHAAASTIFGGVLVVLMRRVQPELPAKRVAIIAVVLWVACICMSRVYLGVHYPTDVLAGVFEGIAWLMLSVAALDHWQVPLGWPRAAAAA